MKRMNCLWDFLITVIQTAKRMGNLLKAVEMDRVKAIGKKNMEVITSLPKGAHLEHGAQKDSHLDRSRSVAKPPC